MAYNHYGVKRRAAQLSGHFNIFYPKCPFHSRGFSGNNYGSYKPSHPIITKSVPRHCHAVLSFRRQGQILVVVTALYPWSCFTDGGGIWEWDPCCLMIFSQLNIWWKIFSCWESATKCKKCNSSAVAEMYIYRVLGFLKSPGKFKSGIFSFCQTMWYKQSNTSNPLVLQHSLEFLW